ncbi:hypothetical protein [Clostridium sp. 'White wine YQ']|uniref:hypothetical protein n=1 Tax=Clostridium sp. 'White wine YQ' TaxID=3027474 RepID=UPI002366E908|nr:hypothetical protein [Clostridium sp. 'White wine YQ']MDD7795260.1 hypothetical protein [Clostridium sp. 'White wine YQ']
MAGVIKFLMNVVNNLHDLLQKIFNKMGVGLNDKQLHFIIIGLLGICIFGITQLAFKKLSKYSITAISFIYTFTVLVVIVFAIEIGQKITKRGNMEFEDIVAGLMGFLYLFIIYLIIKIGKYLWNEVFSRKKSRKTRK